MKRFSLLIVVTVLLMSTFTLNAQDSNDTDLDAIKTYVADNAELMQTATASFLETAEGYYGRLQSLGGGEEAYTLLAEEHAFEAVAMVEALREAWFNASLYYELNEGIVAGTPALEQFDVLLDAGASAEDDPEEALEWTLVLPDGTELDSPGNLFHSLAEPALWGTNPDFIALEVELETADGDVITALPDANLILGIVQRLDEETANLITAVDEWEPTLDDAFHALVVMIPTMNEYFGQWKDSVFVAGDEATETAFIGTSRLFDIVNILTGLIVTYDVVSPVVADTNADLNAQILDGFTDLQTFVDSVFTDEQDGVIFEAEEADFLGEEAQSRAETLAALCAQAAEELGLQLELE